MTKAHLKRLPAPRSWRIKRKNISFITRPKPGAHMLSSSIPLKLVLHFIGKTKTSREASYILHNHEVLVDMKKRRDLAFPVGLFDIVSFPEIKESYLGIFNKQGQLKFVKSSEDMKSKLLKISNKNKIKGNKIQLTTICGRNILVDDKTAAKYGISDTIRIELPEQKIIDHKKIEVGAKVFLIKGGHTGFIANIEDIKGKVIICKEDNMSFETRKDFAFVIDDKIEKLIISANKD